MGIGRKPGTEVHLLLAGGTGGSDRYNQIRCIQVSTGRSRRENAGFTHPLKPQFSKISPPTPQGVIVPTRILAGFWIVFTTENCRGWLGREAGGGVGGRRG